MLGFMGNFDRFSRIDKLCGSLSINFGLGFDNKLRELCVKGWYIKAKGTETLKMKFACRKRLKSDIK